MDIFRTVKDSARGRCGEIITALTPISEELTRKGAADHQCPRCGGGKFYPDTRKPFDETGSVVCRECTDGKPTGDIIATVKSFGDYPSMAAAARAIVDHLGIEVERSRRSPQLDIVETVAQAKRIPPEAFKQFGAKPAVRGRNDAPVARVPVYNEAGEIHSHFDLTPQAKGFFKRGAGSSGLFLPSRLPQPGETWLLVEGVKDAAALAGLGFNCCGLPSSYLAAKYSRLFADVEVITVADLDEPGQRGAQTTGGNLAGIASVVRAARLPGEIVSTGGDDVRDILRRDGEQAIRDAIDNATEWRPRDVDGGHGSGLPVEVLTLNYAMHVDNIIKCLGRLGWESNWIPEHKRESRKLYQRGGLLTEVVEELSPDAKLKGGKVSIAVGTPRIRPLPIQQLPLRITESCRFVVEKVTKGGDVSLQPSPPPKWLIDGVHTAGSYGDSVRRLDGIVTAPTIRPDGSVLQRPGWDAETGLLYRPSMEFPPVPTDPSAADAQCALVELTAVVSDFPFTGDADRAAWLAMVLSMVGRPCVAGQVPLFAITANVRGSGKSMLVDAASMVAYGHTAARTTYASEDDEMRKRITAIALEGAPAVLLDNIDRPIGGASLDAVLTADRWKDRELGQSRNVDLPVRAVWTATGNNLTFRSDISRRVLPIRLDSQLECPEDREDFEHADLLGWIRENRARLVTAALTVLRAYFVAGCPRQPSGQFGSFEAWSETIRGAIVWSGASDPMETRETARADDQSAAILSGVIAGLLEMDDTGNGLTASEIVSRLESSPDQYVAFRTVLVELVGKIDPRRLGNNLRRFKSRVSGGARLMAHKGIGGIMRWSVQPVSGSNGSSGSCSSPFTRENRVVPPTHAHAHAEGPGSDPLQPLDPLRNCDRCNIAMVATPAESGWVNWDCPQCGTVIPSRESGDVT